MTRPFSEQHEEAVRDPERRWRIEDRRKRLVADVERYKIDPKFRARVDIQTALEKGAELQP